MPKPNVLVARTAGTNCDRETIHAFELAGAKAECVHVNALTGAERKVNLDDYQIFVFPGGFSYGDDVGSGKIHANEIRMRLRDELVKFVDDGKLVIGICNGFQTMVKMGLLPGFSLFEEPSVTLINNDSNMFEDRWIYLTVTTKKCVFLKGISRLYVPIAHGEGKFVTKDTSVLRRLIDNDQVAVRYTNADGKFGKYPVNPNGAMYDIAGICDPTGRIFGLMPHPERHALPTQHPRWTREGLKREGEGLAVFRNAVKFF
jgi:phosphoribosylformylglycinamidine synthase